MFVYWSCNLKQVWIFWEEGQFHTIQNGMPLALAHQNGGKRHRVYHQRSTYTFHSKFVSLFWRKFQEEFHTHFDVTASFGSSVCLPRYNVVLILRLLNAHADTNNEHFMADWVWCHSGTHNITRKMLPGFSFNFSPNLQDKIPQESQGSRLVSAFPLQLYTAALQW